MLRALALACLLPLSPALAQNWDTYSYEEGKGAGVCPVDIVATGRYWCFMISCAPEGGPLVMRIAFSDDDVPEDAPLLTIVVDDEDPVERTLRALETEQVHDYGFEIDADRDADLIEALSSGTSATLTLGQEEPAYTYTVSLKRSRSSIEEVVKLCTP